MVFFRWLSGFCREHFFNPKWRCIACGKEVFDGNCFCDKCQKSLPLNDGAICDHCGRKLPIYSPYCQTCKGTLTAVDKARSVFYYAPPINQLIKKAKYYGGRYILNEFVNYLALVYLKNYFNADYICAVPMTKKRRRNRGYNQSEILAKGLCEKVNVSYFSGIIKSKETVRQAKLNRTDRIKNLTGTFKVVDKKTIRDKSVLIVDDVSTTGATGEAMATALKKAGAREVYLLTVASVSGKANY